MKQKQLKTKARTKTNKLRECERAILNSLHYRSIFNASLTWHQLCTFLISDKVFSEKELKDAVRSLLDRGEISKSRSAFHSKHIKPHYWKYKSEKSKESLEEVIGILKLLERIKWIKMLAITGSVAAHNAQDDDDIDIFIITDADRLWLTRLFVALILKLTNRYPSEQSRKGKICPNIYIDSSQLAWDKKGQNVYVAHEILLMHPIVNRDDMYFRFIKANEWIFNFLPHSSMHLPKHFPKYKNKYRSFYIDLLEQYVMSLQKWYMKKRKTQEITTKHVIHFNKGDHSSHILDSFIKLVSTR